MIHSAARQSALLVALAGELVMGCKGTGPSQRTPVDLRLSAAPAQGTSGVVSALVVNEVRLSVTDAALGRSGEFGCIDCQGGTEEASMQAQIVSVRQPGGSVLVATEQASPGRYTDAEISLEQPSAKALQGVPAWPSQATLEIVGSYNGVAFRLPLSITGSFVEHLKQPVDVSAAGGASAALAVTITLPVASWFSANGRELDPANVAQRTLIEANARRAFQALEKKGGKGDG